MLLQRLELQEGHTDTIKDDMKKLTTQLKANTEASEEILDLYNNMKGFLRILAILQKIFLWVGTVSAGGFAIWAAFKFGVYEALNKR